jgi:hypothetical protein
MRRRTGVNYPKWGKNENVGGNEGSININKIAQKCII